MPGCVHSQLLDAFASRGIMVGAQPNCFDALVPLDRRRFYSLPGGTPTREQIERSSHRELVELAGDDIMLELSQQLIEQTPALIDLAVPLGCACAGAGEHAMRGNARGGLLTLEPPRARQRVLDQSVHVDVAQTLIEACALEWSPVEEPAALEVHLAADSAPASNDVRIEIGDVTVEMSGVATDVQDVYVDVDMVGDAVDDFETVDADPHVADVADVIDAEAELQFVVAVTSASEESTVECDAGCACAGGRVAERRRVGRRGCERRGRRRCDVARPSLAHPRRVPRSANAKGEMVPRASLAVMRRALARIAKRKARRQPKAERGRRERAMEIHDGLVRTVRANAAIARDSAAADLPRPVPPPPARYRPRTPLGFGM